MDPIKPPLQDELDFNGIPGDLTEVAKYCASLDCGKRTHKEMLLIDMGLHSSMLVEGIFLGALRFEGIATFWWRLQAGTKASIAQFMPYELDRPAIAMTHDIQNNLLNVLHVVAVWPIGGTIHYPPIK